jgi:hypothetical protein
MTSNRKGRHRFAPTFTTLALLRAVGAGRLAVVLGRVAAREGMVSLLCEKVIGNAGDSTSSARNPPTAVNRAVRNGPALQIEKAQGQDWGARTEIRVVGGNHRRTRDGPVKPPVPPVPELSDPRGF